jgi:Phosphotransferase enzyme family
MKNTQPLPRTVSSRHRAVRSWSALIGRRPAPARVQVLKNEHDRKVWRLIGLGPGDSNVIAKLNPEADATAEHRIYKEALSRLPFRTLHHYGLLKDRKDSFCWAFLEDAGGVPYSADEKEHGVLTAEFLAVLHTSSFKILRDVQLPGRGPSYYGACLEAGRQRICRALERSPLSEEQRIVLTAVAEQCDEAHRRWPRLKQFCAGMPQTFVHGDMGERNVCLRPSLPERKIVLIDWVGAGWGFCGIDLTPDNLDLEAYSLVAQQVWPALDVATCRKLAAVGQLFRLLWAIHGASEYLESGGPRQYWTIDTMSYYRADMDVALRGISAL